jgi:hypothetical protein
MRQKYRIVKGEKIPVWEHLEWTLKKTSYADRLQWLEEANEFARDLKKNKRYSHRGQKVKS